MDQKSYDDFDREAKYILAVRLIKYRDKMIIFMEDMDLTPGSSFGFHWGEGLPTEA